MLPAQASISAAMKWLLNDAHFGLFTFTDLTRFFAALIEIPYSFVLSLISTGFLSGQGSQAVQILPPVSWIATIAIIAMIGHYAGGLRLASARRHLLRLPGGLRPVGQRHGDARLRARSGSAGRRRRPDAGNSGMALAAASNGR